MKEVPRLFLTKLVANGEVYPRIRQQRIRGAHFGNHRSQGYYSNS